MKARQKLIGRRRDTLKAMFLLGAARFLVRFVPLSVWQSSLGTVQITSENIRSLEESDDLETAHYWARRVMRSVQRLPGETKCLPQAVALQWLLAPHHHKSRLIIALHRNGADEKEGLHAWVEAAGKILIGHCERDDYSPIAVFRSA